MRDRPDPLRVVRLRPYRSGYGPYWMLRTWETGRRCSTGQIQLGYQLTEYAGHGKRPEIIFQGEDFGCSPCDAIDSDAALAALLGFLTLRPGDTDAEYFDGYTERQREFCAQHAETLACYAIDRFGEG